MIALSKKEAKAIKQERPRTLTQIVCDSLDLYRGLGVDFMTAMEAVLEEEGQWVAPGRLIETREGITGVLFQSCDYEGRVQWTVNGKIVDPEKLKYYGINRMPKGFCDMEDDFKVK